MAAHRYWRIRCTSTHIAGDYFGVAEFEARLTVGGADQTTGKTMAASATLGGYPTSNSIDNNNSTFWTTGGTAPPGIGHWLSVDLGSAMDIAEVAIRVRPDSYREDPLNLYIEYSDDNVSWTTARSHLGIATWTAGEQRTFLTYAPAIVVPIVAPLLFAEPLTEGDANVRSDLVLVEPLTEGTPQERVSLALVEALSEGYRNLRVSFLFVEVLHPIAPEEYMSTENFPGFGNSTTDPSVPAAADPFNTALPGLGFSVHKKPAFKTRIAEAAGGQEDRIAYWEMPRWDYELTYEFLEDRSGADSSLKTIMGFFMQMQGSFNSWLFKDPDDYKVEAGSLGEADGTTTQFYFRRDLGGFSEIVGQVDTANTITLYADIYEAQTVPFIGPYTITVDHAADFVADLGVSRLGVALTRVSGSPGAMQYSVNESTGVYTFNIAQDNDVVSINYRYGIDPTDYTITMPNYLVFDTAPDEGLTIRADFQFFFVCRFIDDQMDFEKFADKLWSLQTCEFRSIV